MRFDLVSIPYPASENPLGPYEYKQISGVIVGGGWTPELAHFYNQHKVEALYLNVSRGWAGDDYSFLASLPWLRSLKIVAGKAQDLSAIGGLTALEELSIGCTAMKAVDFSGLHSLQRCFLHWWNGASSIFRCTSLESLYLHKLPVKQSAGLAALENLRELSIYSQSMTSLEAIADLATLEKLELFGFRKLESLSGIEKLTSLRSLTLDGCSLLTDLTPLSKLSKLEHLDVSGWKSIDTLSPLRNLGQLRAFCFSGERTKVIDGDLSPLEDLPQLSMLMFGPRQHYSHKLIKPWRWSNFLEPGVLLERKVK